MPEEKVINLGGTIEGFPFQKTGSFNGGNGIPASVSVNDIYNSIGERPVGRPSISINSFYTGDRYLTALPGTDTEEMAAQQQSSANKWVNAIGKMAGVVTGAFVSGTAGLVYGIGKAATDGKFSSLYNNDVTQSMDEMSKYLEDALPNYYTAKEKDADWWSPDNLFTANFWADKVLKNLGYSAGALGGGLVWSQLLRGIGLTNKLVKAGRTFELLEETQKAMTAVPRVQQFAALQNTLSSLGKKYLQGPASSVLKSSDRILTSAMGTFGEASLEALQNLNEFRRNAIEEYKNKYGVEPTGAALDEINEYADNLGNFTWGFNTLLLTGTNYIQLPKILGSSRRNDKLLLGDIERDLSKPIGSQWYTPRPGLLQKTKGAAGLFFAPTEAFEEGAQFAIQTGTDSYFNRAYENKEDISDFFTNLAGAFQGTVNEGVEKTLSTKEGLESILIGGLSGGLQQSLSPKGTIAQEGLFGTGGERGRNTDIAVAALNKTGLSNVLKDQVNYTARAINSQRLRVEAIANNDILSEKDFERDYTLSYIMPRVKYGKVDSINEEVDNYISQAITDEGFMELKSEGIALPNETREAFLKRASSIKELAQSVEGLYSQINDRYSAYVDKNGERIFSDAVVDRMVYAASKVGDYSLRIPEVSTPLISAGVDLQSVLEGIIKNNEPSAEATKAALDYINSLDVLSEEKDNLKRNLQDVMELSLRRKLFIDDYDGIKNNPQDYKEVEKDIDTEEPAVVKQQIKPQGAARKRTVEKELEIGREYALKQLAKAEKGKLQLAPKITVLSKTLGGEYQVKLPDGTETFLKPEEFKQYQIVEQEIDPKEIEALVDESIDAVLAKKKYKNIAKPTDNKLSYINSLDNEELIKDVEKEVADRSEGFIAELVKQDELAQQSEIKKALEETSDVGVQTLGITDDGNVKSYNPSAKKSNQDVVDGTTAPVEGYSQKEPLAEHHVRANRFGANYYTFANKDNFRGVIVTQGNEAQVGVPGLMQWLKDKGKAGAPVDPTKTIALVVMGTDPVTNERYFVGVNGEKLKEPTLDNTIYQVFPEKLTWESGESMFRLDTDVEKALAEDYGKWREFTLKNPSIDLYKIQASFGTPQYVGELDENQKFVFDYTATVPVEDSGLIAEKELRTRRVVGVPTTDGAVVYGSSTFNDVKGIPLLYTTNGLVRLNNRQINKNEASLVYDAIVKLADNLFKDGNLKSNESVMLYNWLKSVVYWGTPKDQQGNRRPAGFSSVFFENMELIMGKEEKKFSLKPNALKKNKAAIIEELQKMYNNVNSTLVSGGQKKDWNKTYTEITAITPEGIQTREWKNYQTFLLSAKNPDGSARNPKTIPLTTRIRPLANAEDTNRKGIYFTVMDKKGNTSQEVTPTTPEKKVVTKPVTPEGAKKEEPVKKFVLDGKTENTLSTKLGVVPFVIDRVKFEETDGTQGISLPDPATDPAYKIVLDSAITKLTTIPKSGVTEETSDEDAIKIAENLFRNIVRNEVKKQLAPAPTTAAVLQPDVSPLAQAQGTTRTEPLTTAVSTDVAKADIERRRQEELNNILGDVIKLEEADTKQKATQAIADATREVGNKALDKAGIIIGEVQWGKNIIDVAKRLAFKIREIQKPAVDRINTKYDAELAALEGAKGDVERSVKVGNLQITQTINSKGNIEREIKNLDNGKSLLNVITPEGKSVFFSLPNLNEAIDSQSEAVKAVVGNININAELAALQGAKTSVAPSLQDRINQRKQAGPTKRGSDFRLMLAKDMEKFKPENWAKVEAFLKATFPNIPVYRVKNYILAANGRRAHGMFQDGAIYLSENAEVGTVYHEVFHAIWQALTSPQERVNIANEFRGRSGSFFDRASLKNVSYSEATDKQMEEKLAEELRDYFQEGKIPQKPAKAKQSWITKLFSDIANFFKTFFTGEDAKSNTEKLFEKIGSGYFKQATPYDSALSFAKKGFIDIEDVVGGELADYSLEIFIGEQVHDLMQHMTYITVRDLFEENKGLFTITKEKKTDILKKLQDELGDLMADNITEVEKMVTEGEATPTEADIMINHYNSLYENIINEWDGLTEKFEEYIKSYSIEFDENDDINVTSDERGKDDPYGDARKIDNMRKTNAAVKLLLASLPVVDSTGTEKLSSIGGYTLLPMSEIFMGTMNNVHTSRSMTEMLNRVKAIANDDPKYIKLYNRLSKLKNIDELDDVNDLQLLSAFWRSFKKQSPDVKTVYILDNGDIQIGDANFTTAARQVKEEFLNNIKEAISKGNKYFKKAENGRSYIGNADAIKGDVTLKKDDLAAQVSFMKELGIEFDLDRLSIIPERTKFAEAVNGIRTSIANSRSIMSVGGRSLSADGRLRELAEIKAKMDNPEFSSTYYNVNGELTQTFIGTNAASDLYDTLSQIKNLSELENTQYSYLLTDSFAKNSVLLYKMFDRESLDRISDTEQLMKTAYADGIIDTKKGKQIESSKLNQKQRLVQELNLNTAGYYLNLIPGDASIGWAQYMGNFVDKSEILTSYKRIHDIFKGYLEDEIALARENRPVAKGRNSEELRFFKSILGDKLQADVLSEDTIKDVYDNYGAEINEAIDKFINNKIERLKLDLLEYGSITLEDNKYKTQELAFGKETMTEEELNLELATLSVNFAINNIELHKLLYSDPYQYSDELKRIKSFNSPRQSIINNSPEMNSAYNTAWNKGFEEGDLGYTDFDKDYFRAATLDDASATIDMKDYNIWEETDGGGIISFKALRNFKIRAGEWDGDQEKQYKYDVAWEKRDKKQKLTNSDKNALKQGNPGVKRTYTPIKPIVSGNKANDRPYNDVVLDKFALYPFSYRILKEVNPTANAVKLYDKMQEENVDYVVFKSGRKVGAENTFSLYKDGKFNEDPFTSEEEKENPLGPQTVLNIPFAIMSIQSEVPSKDDGVVTRGSQMTKLATLDFMQAGVPIDFQSEETDFNKKYVAWNALTEDEKLAYNNGDNLYKEIKNNQNILEALVEEGVNELTSEFGLTKTPEGYEIENLDRVADALKNEITKRELNDNISAALKGYRRGDVFLEATPAYQQIRNILYSIADRAVMSPKMSGGMKVQIPSTLFESGDRIVAKNGALTSDVLKFYTNKDGERVVEIMVARWFKSDMSDQELLTYLNETKEGQKILQGIAFRIPTQKQNSIDVFRIKKFLPKEFGDSVVIPSALVKKVGSDFDIDKLNVYFKNVDDSGTEPRLIPFQGTSEKVRNRFKNRRDFKKSLENGYIESLEKLTSHPLNFNNLIKPNSADQLKDLSKEIVSKLGLGTFDYNDPGNMLDRRFMSRLRHAFVTGKYAIGIAAVNQTNHSLNQRQPVYINMNRAILSTQDSKWIGDGKIRFKEYNTIEIDGESRPTISMIENKAGDNISDILGQMIDGYVDISKDTWIIEMGITPNVASTWMFLVKVGVPVDTVAYFMNQPIIREYLRELEKKGSTWLFDNKLVKRIEMRYRDAANVKVPEIPSNEDLLEMIGKKTLSAVEKTEQKYMLREFLKYAKMGQQLFYVTQGTNFDTSTFNDPFLLFKKLYMLDRARNTIFSSKVGDEEMSAADALLEQSFLGKLKDGIVDVREAIAEILRMDKGGVRELLQDVLTPYLDQNDRDFIRTSQRAVTTLIDWAVQTEKNLNTKIEEFLISKEKNVARRITDFINTIKPGDALANNHVIKTLKPNFADPLATGEVNNLYLKNKTNKVYDQNQIIYGFKELKNYLKSQNNIALYNDMVTLSILQSGLSQSTVSFTSLLPYDDVMETYNDVIGNLSAKSNLKDFKNLNVFERTFWNYDDVVPHMEAQYRVDWLTGFPTYNENMKFRPDIYEAMKSKEIPLLLRISENSKEANYDVIVYTYEKEIKAAEKRKMREAGDYSYIKKALFKKVGMVGNNYIYKAINAWGDGIYAKEFYSVPQKSKIDNGFVQSDETIIDEKIMSYFGVTLEESILEEDSSIPEEEVVEIFTEPEVKEESISELEITVPKRERKKTEFQSKVGDVTVTKKGYKVIIPEYPNVSLYITKDTMSQEGIMEGDWFVEETTTSLIFPTSSWTIDGILGDIKKTVNKNLKNKENRKVLESVGFTKGEKTIQPEGLPSIDDTNKNNCGS
jgi:hypothetical protein